MLSIASLLAGYLACTTPNLLDAQVVNTTECMATEDLQEYAIIAYAYHGDKVEITVDLMDDRTAILWVDRDALNRSETE